MFIDERLIRDPYNKESVMGWGVVRCDPWYLVGVYASEDEARRVLCQFDINFEVVYGSYSLGSNSFIWGIEY